MIKSFDANSSNIETIAHSDTGNVLWVTFKGGAEYKYENVTPAIFAFLETANNLSTIHDKVSLGSLFNATIKARPDLYPCTKV